MLSFREARAKNQVRKTYEKKHAGALDKVQKANAEHAIRETDLIKLAVDPKLDSVVL